MQDALNPVDQGFIFLAGKATTDLELHFRKGRVLLERGDEGKEFCKHLGVGFLQMVGTCALDVFRPVVFLA